MVLFKLIIIQYKTESGQSKNVEVVRYIIYNKINIFDKKDTIALE
jgi:hypothetical protein